MANIKERIATLENYPLEDHQCNIEGPSLSLGVSTNPFVNFIDRNAYDTKFLNDMQLISTMRTILERGEYFVNIIYTYRSCSKALPQSKGADDPNKEDLHQKTFEVLEPEIQKVKDLYDFQNLTVGFFCDQVKLQTSRLADFIPEAVLWYMIKLLDMLALLDALLNMKACLVTDFSFYKRAFGFLKPGETSQDQLLSRQGLFLAQQNSITENLKRSLADIPKFDEILLLIVNMCATYIETERYVLPSDKHSLLRVMPYGLFLIDGTEGQTINIFKNKKVNIKRFATLFKRYPVVSLYGDMQIKLETLIKTCPNYATNQREWPLADTERVAREYELVHHLPTIRQQHFEFTGKFRTLLNSIRLNGITPQSSEEDTTAVTNTLLEGLLLLSNWTSRVLQQCAWKYSKPAPLDDSRQAALENSYEQVVKLNYSREECLALAETIGLIKGLAGCLMQEDGALTPFIASCIHHEIQQVVQINVGEMLISATKKKRPIRVDLVQIKNLAADYVDGSGLDETTLLKLKKKTLTVDNVKIKSRPVGPSPTQLEILRTSFYNLFAPRGNGKRPYEKDLSKENAKAFEDFYSRSFFYPYLLDFKESILQMIDLGDLWYREFYLELTKRLQFPIALSLPWILTDSILEGSGTGATSGGSSGTGGAAGAGAGGAGDSSGSSSSMIEYVLYPLDIYNDAANRALSSLHQQFLYDEIEAEVNLCFDQLIFKLSDNIYTTFKTQASAILLDSPLRTQLETQMATKLQPPKNQFTVIASQRHYQLLGRSVDLNHLIAQRLNNYLRTNIENAISRYEAKAFHSIVELRTQLTVLRMTCDLLHPSFPQLDSFDAIFHEVNDGVSLVSFHSRVVFHTISELVADFLPNHNYNTWTQRFVRVPIQFADQVERENPPSQQPHFLYGSRHLTAAFAAQHESLAQFIGKEHLEALIEVIGPSNLSLVIDECLTHLHLKVENILVPYVSELMNAMPPNSKCPLYDYKLDGGVGYFSGKLMDLIRYPPLQEDVFQHFREFGNAIAFLQLLATTLEEFSLNRFGLASSFLGCTPNALKESLSHLNNPVSPRSARGDSKTPRSPHGGKSSNGVDDGHQNLERKSFGGKEHFSKRVDSIINGIQQVVSSSSSSSVKDGSHSHLLVDKIQPSSLENIRVALHRASEHYESGMTGGKSLFKACLDRIYSIISTVRDEWDQQTPEEGAVIPVESSREFYRLFSAMRYIYCLTPERGQGEWDNYALFGDGLLWAGWTIIHMLGQKKRYLSFDFVDHLLRVSEVHPVDPNDKKSLIFLQNATRTSMLSEYVFQVLDTFVPEYQPYLNVLHPPQDDSDSQHFKITSTLVETVKVESSAPNLVSPRSPHKNSPSPRNDLPPPPSTPAPPPPSS